MRELTVSRMCFCGHFDLNAFTSDSYLIHLKWFFEKLVLKVEVLLLV